LRLRPPCRAAPSPFQLAFAMSSTGALGGAGAGGPGGSSGRKHVRPFGSRNTVKDPTATPPVPRKCGRLPGSRKKKTLAALAATAAADSAGVAPAVDAAAAPTGAVVTAAVGAAAPTGAVTTAALAVTPIEAAAAIIGAVISVGAAPLASPVQAPAARLVPPPPWCTSPGIRRHGSGSPTPQSTGSPPSWPIFRPGARCAYRSPSGSSTPWEGTP
jgi:hypothetical protein